MIDYRQCAHHACRASNFCSLLIANDGHHDLSQWYYVLLLLQATNLPQAFSNLNSFASSRSKPIQSHSIRFQFFQYTKMATSVASSRTGTDSTLLSHPPSSTAFLWDAPPLTYDDFDPNEIDLRREEMKIIDEFEQLWKDYLKDHPEGLPTGKKGARIESLETKLLALQRSKQNVEAELQRQLEFFDNSKAQLEGNFDRLKLDAQKEQEQMVAGMERRVDAIGTSARHSEANGDWGLFFEALGNAIEQSDVKTLPGDGLSTVFGKIGQSPRAKTSSAMKPSAKAMFLNNAAAESDSLMKSRDFLFGAFRIDNTLLHAQVKMLQRDIERVEQGTKTTEFVGKFMTEHNIFGLLSSSGSQSGGTTK
jgi:hypothetical protein